jgi:phosphatidylglycerol:prolipoprotein diacylglycerol transferase
MTLAYYLHNLTPEIFRIGWFAPRWYGIAYLLGFIGAYFLLAKLIRDGIMRMPMDQLGDFVLFGCIFGVLIGGRLGYVFFYQPHLLWDFSSELPFWGVLKINQGGMSAHGGVAGVILALFYFCRKHNLPFINVGDCSVMVVPIGLFFGRIANFINGELYGHVTSVPWAVKFPSELVNPTNGVFDVPDDSVLQMLANVQGQNPSIFNSPQQLSPTGMCERVIDLARHGNQFAQDQLAAILPARHPSQLYEAFLEGICLFALVWTVGRLWRKDGMAASAFLIGYPLARIAGEQFRVGDTVRSYLGVHLSLGEIYSLAMLAAGVVFFVYFVRKPDRLETKPE